MTNEHLDDVRNFIRHVVSAMSGALLYSPEHPQVRRLTEDAFSNLRKTFESRDKVSLLLIDNELVYDNTPVEGGMFAGKLARAFSVNGIGHIEILRQVQFDELKSLITGLAQQLDDGKNIRSSPNIRLGKLDIKQKKTATGKMDTDSAHGHIPLKDIPFFEQQLFLEICENVRGNKRIDMSGVNMVVRSCIHSFKQTSSSFPGLAPLHALDDYTFTHSTNVCILNLSQAMSLGLEGRLLHEIGVAGMLHDIGKLFIPEEILAKPGKLTESEMDLIKQHPVRGAHYILDIPNVSRLSVVCCYEHHMKYDGTGYPRAREGWKQNVSSQITAISDYFDALRTRRVYRDALDATTVGAMVLENSGTFFNPFLVRNFLRILVSRQAEASPVEKDKRENQTPPATFLETSPVTPVDPS
ncbi:MAG: HD domain-containing protein [Geobacteraceae bacterium]|nr:HD domain-containing protein [Geobacteraceae bacterium]